MGLGDRDYMRSGSPAGVSWGSGGRKPRGRWSALAILVAINLGIFVIQYVFQLWGESIEYIDSGGNRRTEFMPSGGASAELVFSQGHFWTLFTYMFVHGSFLHILCNLILIVACGRGLQAIAGERHLFWTFMFSGLLGGLAQIGFSLFANPSIPVVGASACAFGLLVALAVLIPEQEVSLLLFFVIPLRLRLKYLACSLVGLAVVLLVVDLLVSGNVFMVSGVGHAAHLGGALAGWLYVRSTGLCRMRREPRFSRRRRKRSTSQDGTIVSTTLMKEVDGVVIETDEFAMNRINDLLEKISNEGMGNLTDEERRVLEQYSRRISGKTS
ncbi:MAG: rhomboid family intramembrane serine protease [Verrucomicrobiaceae bacterium]|nr:rhomboid family intramembrane serine protease [Verrucomicrobiaceae bacterium]